MPQIKEFFDIEHRSKLSVTRIKAISFFALIIQLGVYLYSGHFFPIILSVNLAFALFSQKALPIIAQTELFVVCFVHAINLFALTLIFFSVMVPYGVWHRLRSKVTNRWPLPNATDGRVTVDSSRAISFLQPY